MVLIRNYFFKIINTILTLFMLIFYHSINIFMLMLYKILIFIILTKIYLGHLLYLLLIMIMIL